MQAPAKKLISPQPLTELRGDWGANCWKWPGTDPGGRLIKVPEHVYAALVEIAEADELDFDARDLRLTKDGLEFRGVEVREAPINCNQFHEPPKGWKPPEERLPPQNRTVKTVPEDEMTPEQKALLEKRRANMKKAQAARQANLAKKRQAEAELEQKRQARRAAEEASEGE